VTRNSKCDRIGGASAGDRTGGGEGADPIRDIGIGHGSPDRDRAKLLPDAVLKRCPTYIKWEMKPFGRVVYEANYFRQFIVDRGLVGDKIGFGKAGREVRPQLDP
jgi:hypothetical protein